MHVMLEQIRAARARLRLEQVEPAGVPGVTMSVA
jgi:hypothetical protein